MSYEENEVEQNSTMQMCTFRMANRLFGVNILDVKEVNENINVTPIYHAPPDICGYINVRGQILLVVNLRETFGFDQSHRAGPANAGRVVVFKSSVDEPFGILVDEVCDVISIEYGRIVDRRAGTGGVPQEIREMRRSRDNIVIGVCPLDKELLLVLNARCILSKQSKTLDAK
ncbi:MAG: chemotaxis protein CheW [Fibromonadaceae bacterium]|jgi:purine-binding chemotaxis protein CheW|nr:chemotaxis protein CheW [Fibromonadaceae bacterium]